MNNYLIDYFFYRMGLVALQFNSISLFLSHPLSGLADQAVVFIKSVPLLLPG